MERSEIIEVGKVLQKLESQFPIIWDRYTENEGHYVVYGWIARGDEKVRDFILLYIQHQEVWYSTSSAKYSHAICQSLYGNSEVHNHCRRVTEFYTSTIQ